VRRKDFFALYDGDDVITMLCFQDAIEMCGYWVCFFGFIVWASLGCP